MNTSCQTDMSRPLSRSSSRSSRRLSHCCVRQRYDSRGSCWSWSGCSCPGCCCSGLNSSRTIHCPEASGDSNPSADWQPDCCSHSTRLPPGWRRCCWRRKAFRNPWWGNCLSSCDCRCRCRWHSQSRWPACHRCLRSLWGADGNSSTEVSDRLEAVMRWRRSTHLFSTRPSWAS